MLGMGVSVGMGMSVGMHNQWHCITRKCHATPCTALHCTALHCTAPHCTTPHHTVNYLEEGVGDAGHVMLRGIPHG